MDRPEVLVKHFQKLQDDLTVFMPLIKQNLLNYRMLESQESQQMAINEDWRKKNIEAEAQFNRVVAATKDVENKNQALDQELNTNRNTLWVKAHTKFKEIEKMIEDADRSRIKKALKEMESVAA